MASLKAQREQLLRSYPTGNNIEIHFEDWTQFSLGFRKDSQIVIRVAVNVTEDFPAVPPLCWQEHPEHTTEDIQARLESAMEMVSNGRVTVITDFVDQLVASICRHLSQPAPSTSHVTSSSTPETAMADEDVEEDYLYDDDDAFGGSEAFECLGDISDKRQRTTIEGAVDGDKLPDDYQLYQKYVHQSSSTSAMTSSPIATDRLMKELKALMRNNKDMFEAEPIHDNLYKWEVKLYIKDETQQVAKDLANFGNCILLHMHFKNDFPHTPPFVQLVRPRLKGNFIFPGGALCMELLTPQGWSPANSIEAVVLQIQAMITYGDSRVDMEASSRYGDTTESQARIEFQRICDIHKRDGWSNMKLWKS